MKKNIETIIMELPAPSEKTLKSVRDLKKYILSLELSNKQKEKLQDKIKTFVAYARADIVIAKIEELDIDNDIDPGQLN